MNIFDNLFPGKLYHSYIIFGDPIGTSYFLRKFLEDKGHISPQSPDVLCQNYDSFTILDGKFIKDWGSSKGVTDGKKICIIGAKSINREAEQSLLKILEEPGENTHFFIIVPPSVVLLDTILSRSHIIKLDINIEIHNVDDFIGMKAPVRILYIASLLKKHEDDETSGGLRYSATSLTNQIEKIYYEKFRIERQGPLKEALPLNSEFILEELQKCRGYLNTPGASVKMILEHIALIT